ncbi:MAG: GatB/YqeY domain-containing protein [Alphaproteobacteria bacterium]|nr:GatB/YqeY domain-containing protein [Alphaproteobacteria bacterium]MBP7758782.1 GatB/YqeY domain-containing protein [Alphaproteobacteria bacterium]MBP7762144.1 GatB/YqeY domain-containing protein [Alphaproteobacteria bacterium]MBP7904157.1 GatB/YqeY domain-containing protein [Alphaproteobacteria bacterium]
MQKRAEINNAYKEAMKKQDKDAVGTLRLILAAIKSKDIDARGQGGDEGGIGDGDILSLLQSMIKQRQDSIQQYKAANRNDLAEKEQKEIDIIQGYLPQQLGDSEVEAAVAAIISETGAAGVKDMGKVMGLLKTRYAGQMDMGKAGAIVKQKLA